MVSGSLTALPVIETQAGDVSAYIPTNVISITDGQIFLETELFYKGIRPAVNVGLSVSRVGSAAQIKDNENNCWFIKIRISTISWSRSICIFWLRIGWFNAIYFNARYSFNRGIESTTYKPLVIEHQLVLIFAAISGYLGFYRS